MCVLTLEVAVLHAKRASKNILKFAGHRPLTRHCTGQVLVNRNNKSVSDMPATEELDPICHSTMKLLKCILD